MTGYIVLVICVGSLGEIDPRLDGEVVLDVIEDAGVIDVRVRVTVQFLVRLAVWRRRVEQQRGRR